MSISDLFIKLLTCYKFIGDDKSFHYHGYYIRIIRKKEGKYKLSIYKDGHYIMGYKGLLGLECCIKHGKLIVDKHKKHYHVSKF